MRLELEDFVIRSFAPGDVGSLVAAANNRRVAAMLRDRFPHPYTRQEAERWIAKLSSARPETGFALATADEVIGGIGLELGEDVHVRSAELGYWVAEPYWGQGIATRAVKAFVPWAFATFPLHRIHAAVFASNPASTRVLTKAGFTFEGRMCSSVLKNGEVLDELIFSILRDEGNRLPTPRPPSPDP